MRAGKEVVVHGDGTSLWTLTPHQRSARGFVPLLGHVALGEAFQIMSDDAPTWDAVAHALAAAAGVEPRMVHVPSDAIATADPVWCAARSATGPARRALTPGAAAVAATSSAGTPG